ncbi:MAG: flagellar hook-length control protein FliK, partial [Planctomycetes bacterium]|nr:flagellar hook-length control protein FliK [Planctomycetota bacterium]
GEEPSAVIAKAPSGDDGEAPSAVIAKAPSGDDGEAPSATAEQNTPQSLTGVAHTPTERASQTEAPQPRAQTPTQQSGGELPVPDLQELAIKTVRWQRLDAFAQAGSARIRLSPPQLGTVEVMMHTSNNVVRVQMVVETEAVRQLLQAHSGRLTQNLLALGMNTQQLEIVVETPAELPYKQTEQQGGGQGRREGQAQQGPFSQDRSFAEQVEEEINLMA